jgi:hypothetical protein
VAGKRKGKAGEDKQRQVRGRQRHADLQSRGKKGREIYCRQR